MNREQLLGEIKNALITGVISSEDLRNLSKNNEVAPITHKEKSNLSLTKLFYYIGGGIVFLGLTIFVFQNWDLLNAWGKIFVTLGVFLVSYYFGYIFSKNEKSRVLSVPFYLISCLLLPVGMYVFQWEFGVRISITSNHIFLLSLMCLFYYLNFSIRKSSLFLIFLIIYGTSLFINLTSYLLNIPIYPEYSSNWNFLRIMLIISGFFYIYLGRYLFNNYYSKLTGILYGFGSLFVLGMAFFMMMDYASNYTIVGFSALRAISLLGYVVLLLLFMYFSVLLKSGSILTFSTIFIIIFILYVTGEFFSNSFGWPISLVIIGLSLIFVPYYAFRLRARYLK